MTVFQRRSSTTDTLELTPLAGHRYELVDVAVNALGAGHYLDINMGGKVVTRVYGNKHDMICLGGHGACEDYLGFFELLRAKAPAIPRFSSAQDQLFTLKYSATPTIHSIYFNDLTGVDVVTHTIPGASDGYPRLYIGWATHSAILNTDAVFKFDKSLAPVGMPTIRDGYLFSGIEFELIGIIFASRKVGASSPTFFRIWDTEIPLFDDTRKGFRVHADNNELKADTTKNQIFILPEHYKFAERTTIYIEFDFDFDGTNTIPADDLLLGLIGLLHKPV